MLLTSRRSITTQSMTWWCEAPVLAMVTLTDAWQRRRSTRIFLAWFMASVNVNTTQCKNKKIILNMLTNLLWSGVTTVSTAWSSTETCPGPRPLVRGRMSARDATATSTQTSATLITEYSG